MKSTMTNDITLELSLVRAAAATPQTGLRILEDLELGWIAGGDYTPNWDNSSPPPGP